MRLVAAPDGLHVAVVHDRHVAIVHAESQRTVAEVGLAGSGTHSSDVAFAGRRLVVLTRGATAATLHVIAPGPTLVGSVPLRGDATLLAVSTTAALVRTATGASLVELEGLAVRVLPLRAPCAAAASTGDDRLVLATGGALEEWDVTTRAPGRRLRLDHKLEPLHLGGNAQRLWFVAREMPAQLEVITLAALSRRSIALAGSARTIAASPAGDLVVVDDTGTASLVDLARESVTPCARDIVDASWLGHRLVLLRADGSLELRDPGHAPRLARGSAPVIAVEPEPVPAPPAASPPVKDALLARLEAWRARAGNTLAPTEITVEAAEPAAAPRERTSCERIQRSSRPHCRATRVLHRNTTTTTTRS